MWQRIRSAALFGAVTAFLVSAALIAADLHILSPRGSPAVMHPSYVAIFPLMLAGFLFLAALVLLLPQATRTFAAAAAAFCLAYVAVGIVGINVIEQIRMRPFAGVAQRSEPLVAAIHRFEAEQNRPPARLEELVPRYLAAIPGTGLGAHPHYRYEPPRGDEGWALFVDASAGPFDWSKLMYLPDQSYSPHMKRIGKWAYVQGD